MDLEIGRLIYNAREKNVDNLKAQLEEFETSESDVTYPVFPHVRELEPEHGWTILHLGCALKEESIVEAVLKLPDINVNVRSKQFQQSPLHIAASVGSAAIVTLLIKAQARINQVDAAGYTALHYASFEGYRSVAEILLQAYTQQKKTEVINIRDQEGFTALDLAKRANNSKIIEIIQQFMYQQLPHYMVSEEERQQVENWLSQTVRLPQYVDAFVANGYTRLEYWAKRGISKQEYLDMGILLAGHQNMINDYLSKLISKQNEDTDPDRSESEDEDSSSESSESE